MKLKKIILLAPVIYNTCTGGGGGGVSTHHALLVCIQDQMGLGPPQAQDASDNTCTVHMPSEHVTST